MKSMKMTKVTAALAAIAMTFSTLALSASAEAAPNTFRTALEKQYVFASDLASGDVVVKGNVFIDNYTGMNTFKITLESASPLVIENGGFADPCMIDYCKDTEKSYTVYENTDASGAPCNVAMFYNDYDNATDQYLFPYPNATAVDNTYALLSFDVKIPKGTEPGVYKLGCKEGFDTNEVGQKEYHCFATSATGSVELAFEGAEFVVEPDAIRGDVNCDGAVDTKDATAVLRYYAGSLLQASEDELFSLLSTPYVHAAVKAADTDNSSSINQNDAVKILRYYSYKMLNGSANWDEV